MIGWIILIAGVFFLVVLIITLVYSFSPKPASHDQRIEDLSGQKYSTDMNRFVARKEAKASEARGQLLTNLSVEMSQLYNKEKLASDIKLLRLADAEDLDIPTYLSIREQAERNRLELEKNWQEIQNQLKAGFIYQLQGHQHLRMLTDYIAELYQKADEYEAADRPKELELVKEFITVVERDFRERQKRLLQIGDGEKSPASNPDTNS